MRRGPIVFALFCGARSKGRSKPPLPVRRHGNRAVKADVGRDRVCFRTFRCARRGFTTKARRHQGEARLRRHRVVSALLARGDEAAGCQRGAAAGCGGRHVSRGSRGHRSTGRSGRLIADPPRPRRSISFVRGGASRVCLMARAYGTAAPATGEWGARGHRLEPHAGLHRPYRLGVRDRRYAGNVEGLRRDLVAGSQAKKGAAGPCPAAPFPWVDDDYDAPNRSLVSALSRRPSSPCAQNWLPVAVRRVAEP
jgi:hypothetical protein